MMTVEGVAIRGNALRKYVAQNQDKKRPKKPRAQAASVPSMDGGTNISAPGHPPAMADHPAKNELVKDDDWETGSRRSVASDKRPVPTKSPS
jgi:hypothetical protein